MIKHVRTAFRVILSAISKFKKPNKKLSVLNADIVHFVEKLYNLRNNSIMQRQANRTVYFGTESISSLAPKLWEFHTKLKAQNR